MALAGLNGTVELKSRWSVCLWLTITVSVLPNRTQKFCFLWEQRISILGLQTRPRLLLRLKSTPGFTTSFSPRLLPLLRHHHLDCPSTTVRPDSTPSLTWDKTCATFASTDHTDPAPLAHQLQVPPLCGPLANDAIFEPLPTSAIFDLPQAAPKIAYNAFVNDSILQEALRLSPRQARLQGLLHTRRTSRTSQE